jgi:hypothetical protein
MRGRITSWLKGLAIIAVSAIGTSSAHAGLTSIGKHPTFEVGQQDILAHQYGGSWHAVGDDFYNGGISAKRMDDFLSVPSVLDIAKGDCGFSTDQMWSGKKFTVSAVAKWSGNSQRLGILDGHGNTHGVLDVTGYGYNVDHTSKTVDMSGATFKWQRSGDSGVEDSLNSDNADNRDHLITYIVSGLPGVKGPVWMLFFEDMIKTASTKKNATFADFNDLVVEVRPAINPVPLPPAGWAGLFTLGCFAIVRGHKLMSRAMTA